MRKVFFSTAMALAWCNQPAVAATPAQQLQKIADAYFEDGLNLYPLNATYTVGEPRFEGKLTIDISPSILARDKALQQRVLKQTAALNRAALSPADQLSWTVLRYQAQMRLDGLAFPWEQLPIDQYGGVPAQLAQLASGQDAQPLKTDQNYGNFLKRLEVLPAWNAQAIANMRAGIAQGVVLQRPIIERAIETLQPLASADPAKHPYLQPIRNFPQSLSAVQRQHWTRTYGDAFAKRLQPSMAELLRFLREEYLPRGRDSAGMDALPRGKDWYAYSVRMYTTTAMEPEAIHALGLAEVARILGEVDKLKQQAGFVGTSAEFLRQSQKRPENHPFKTEQEVLDAYEALNQKIKTALPALFKRAPKAPLVIRPEPELTRATASDHYAQPAADGSRPGIFYAVIMDPKDYATTQMSSLFLHEGQPGHHFHLAGQMELPLPKFRRFAADNAYTEGWALYAETLGHEMGLYQDSNALLGHLMMELHRAIRLVVDTGLHAKGWTREQTMRYMMDTEGQDESSARRATERYMAWPGQALGYKIGALKIRALRDQAQAALGAKFSYADFHEQILSEGTLPLNLLEDKTKAWIAAQR